MLIHIDGDVRTYIVESFGNVMVNTDGDER